MHHRQFRRSQTLPTRNGTTTRRRARSRPRPAVEGMGMCNAFLRLTGGLFLIAVTAALILSWAVITDRYPPPPSLPDLPDVWFGSGQKTQTDFKPRPFKINVSDNDLTDLRTRLAADYKRFTETSQSSQSLADSFDDGTNSKYLTQVLAPYWLKSYDWRRAEKALNAMGNHFKVNINGLDVHYVHAKPHPASAKGKKVIPLLIAHGWPGSFVEFIKLIPMLTHNESSDFVFEVVAPSIPGYGFSSAPRKPGFHLGQCAKTFKELMSGLGHEKFYTQGGDWGSFITASMAVAYPDSILGHHTNMAMSQRPSSILKSLLTLISPRLVLDPHEDKFIVPYTDKLLHALKETGYLHLQATRPDTVGVGLTTSPLGLLAYIAEKFATFSTTTKNLMSPDGNLPSMFTMDEILDNIMVYWITGTMTSSMRFYKENFARQENLKWLDAFNMIPISVPSGVANAEEELITQPKSILTSRYPNMVTYDILEGTGHFAAYQAPEKLFKSFIGFVQKVENLAQEGDGSKARKPEL